MDRPHPINKKLFLTRRYSDRVDQFVFHAVEGHDDFIINRAIPYYNQAQFKLCELIFRVANTEHWTTTDCVSVFL